MVLQGVRLRDEVIYIYIWSSREFVCVTKFRPATRKQYARPGAIL